jgi:hypothetical protein
MENLNTVIGDLNQMRIAKLEQVRASTGSMHTRMDVQSIINDLMQEVEDLVSRVINDAPAPAVVTNGFSREDIAEVVRIATDNMSWSKYIKADLDSAEFELSYDYKIELTDCECEADADDFIDDLIVAVNEGLDELEANAPVQSSEYTDGENENL